MSKKKIIILGLLFLEIYSCTFYRTTSDYKTESEFYASINSQSMSREVHITFNNDSVYIGTNYKISSDSSHWIDLNHGNEFSQSNSNINSISFEHPVRGMINGWFIGGAGAMIIAAPVLHYNKDEFEDELAPIMVLAGIGLIGSITGAILGYNISDKHVYELNKKE